MARHAAEWVMSNPSLIPTDVNENVGAIIELLHTLAQDRPAPEPAARAFERFRDNSALEGDGLISIVGPRGSGKTTLLAATCVELLASEHAIVLPIIRPEIFRVTDSLTTIIVASLAELLSDALDARDPQFSRESADVQLAVHRTLRAAALSTAALGDSLARRSDSLSQYALDVVGVIQSRDELVPSLRALVSMARQELCQTGPVPIVIPIDDADLVPGRAAEVLSDLRQLSAVDGLIPIVTFHREDLQRSVEADLSRSSGRGTNDGTVSTLAHQQIEKTIRPALTVEPPTIAPQLRSAFKPVGEDRSLLDLLAEVLNSLDEGRVTARRLLEWVGSAASSRTHTNIHGAAWLPETPRQLETLWRILRQLANSLADQAPTTGTWLKRLVETIGASSPAQFRMNLDIIETRFENRLVRVEASTRWSRVDLYTDPQVTRRTRVSSPIVRIDFRPFLEPVMRITEDNDTSSAVARQRVEPMATASILMLDSIFQMAAFDGNRPHAPGLFRDFDYWALQGIRLLGEATDDRFFAMPWTRGAVQFERSRVAWNHLTRSVSVPTGTGAFTFVARYMNAVERIWLDGEIAEAVRSTEFNDSFMRLTERYIAISDAIYLPAELFRNYSPELAFCRWYENSLPFVFHDLLLPDQLADEVVGDWYAAVTREAREGVADTTQSELRDAFRTRIDKSVSEVNRANPTGVWFYGYTSLLRAIDAELANSVSHHRDKYHALKRKAKLGRSLASGTVVRGEARSSRWGEGPATTAGDFELELILQTVDRLREA